MTEICTPVVEKKKTKVEELRLLLEAMGLETCGNKPALKERLRKAKKKQEKSAQQELRRQEQPKALFDYYLFFDVEATCEKDGGFNYPNEIIEFPIVLVSGETFDIVDEFRSYVRPTVNPILSDYCTYLTGIDQATVDVSPPFVEVLDEFQKFMSQWSLFQDKTAAFVTDGPFDIRDFITKQCAHSQIKKRPAYFTQPWVDIRKLFREFYKRKTNTNIDGMLTFLGLTFEGRPHSGLDDARNIVAIARRMRSDGCEFMTNCKLRHDKKSTPPYVQQPTFYLKKPFSLVDALCCSYCINMPVNHPESAQTSSYLQSSIGVHISKEL